MFGQIYVPLVNWFLLAAVLGLVLTFRSPTGLANAYGIALSAIFATNTFLAFVVFRSAWHKPLWMIIPGATLFLTVELTFFAANLTKVFHGGWFPLVVGAIFFTILTTWHRGRSELARVMREGRVTVRKFINRMIDERPDRVPGTAVFLTQSLETAPTALLRNVEHNGVLHERVVLLKLETVGVPHVANAHRLRMEQLRLGFLALTARYGYQDEPDVVAVIRLAAAQGADLDPDRVVLRRSRLDSSHRSNPDGRLAQAPVRAAVPELIPAARYYGIPPDQVFEVGAYVQLRRDRPGASQARPRSQSKRRPSRVNSGSTRETVRQWGTTIAASPPVATAGTGSPSSSRKRSTSPSTRPACPSTEPDRIASTVSAPIACRGGRSSISTRRAACSARALSAIVSPGAIAPPRNPPPASTASTVVAVPRSQTMQLPPRSACAATQFAIRSGPAVPPSTSIGGWPSSSGINAR